MTMCNSVKWDQLGSVIDAIVVCVTYRENRTLEKGVKKVQE